MTYTTLILISVLLNVGQAYIIYMMFMRNQSLDKSLKDISKIANDAIKKLEPKKREKTPEKTKSNIPWYKYYGDK
jgi:hypothetical protein